MLENIEIVDYKCFKDFKLDGLSQINIISGGNNVGKTALLEALFIERIAVEFISTEKFIDYTMSVISANRDIEKSDFYNYLTTINYFATSNSADIILKSKIKRELNELEISKLEKKNRAYTDFIICKINDNLKVYPVDNIIKVDDSVNYINSSKPTTKILTKLYSYIQNKNIQPILLDYLKILDKNISRVEPQLLNNQIQLRIEFETLKESFVISELGEGLSRYMEILIGILGNFNGTVFIDEIENGIHYSKLKDIAKAIIEIVQKENIQLFITTHDKETIEAFSEACEELDFKDISSIELYKDKENIIQSVVRNFEQFIATVDAGMDIR